MLIQAQGDGNSQAGQRLQRLTTELVRIYHPVTWAQCSASLLVNPAVHLFFLCPDQQQMRLRGHRQHASTNAAEPQSRR